MDNIKGISVGDWVLFGEEYREVESINGDGCVELCHTDIDPDDLITDIKHIQPVVMTKELLHQLGFKEIPYITFALRKEEVIVIENNQIDNGYKWKIIISNNGGRCMSDITYIHELQHLCTIYGCNLCLNLWESYLNK